MTEQEWDKTLKIRTTGRDDSNSDTYRYPYEPTSYDVLDRLIRTGYIEKKNTVLDYGCGKLRVSLYLSYQTKCHSIGIEYDARIYERAITNKESCSSGSRVQFICSDAKVYDVPYEVDRIFFFNRAKNKKLLRKIKTADVLFIKSIDRLGRNYDEIIEQWRIII